MFKSLRALAAFGALALAIGGVYSIAQERDTAGRDSTTARTTDRNDDGFDLGWLGLAGLAGLAGLMPRDRRDRDNGPKAPR